MFVEALIFTVTLILLTIYLHRKPKGLPPGEWGLPIVGYIPFVKSRIPETIKDLQKKHGKIFSMKMGTRTFIFVADYDLIRNSFNKPEFSGRPKFYTYDLYMYILKYGITTTEGEIWMTNRKFAINALSDFGFAKSSGVDFIMPEVEYLVQFLKTKVGKPLVIDWSLNVAILNVLWRICANRRYEAEDEELKNFSRYITENLHDIDGPMSILNYLPWLIPIIPEFVKDNFLGVGIVKYKRQKLLDYLSKIVDEHRKTINSDNPRDYIDKYLLEAEKNKGKPEYAHFGDLDLLVTLLNLFLAGTDTTSSVLRWFIAFMAKYPKVQRRVQQQIDSVVPRDRIPMWQDKPKLPYLEALIHEVGRASSFLPMAVPHAATTDTSIGGYTVPKDSIVILCVESCHNDKRYWKTDGINLENFLDENGKFCPKKESYAVFSFGRRKCVGDVVAKMQLFLFMGAILQNFEIHEPEDEPISLEPNEHVSLFNYCRDYKVLLKNRT